MASIDCPPEVSEWDISGLTKIPSLFQVIDIPHPYTDVAPNSLVLGLVKCIHVQNAVLDKDALVDATKLKPVVQLGDISYSTFGMPFRIPRVGGQPTMSQQNVFYTDLHARANEEGDAMSKSFKENYQVHPRGDGALTKELSNKGMAHKAEMEKLHRKASEWIFTQNNIVRSGNVPCRFIGSDVLNTATRAGEQPRGSRLAWSLCERSHIFHGTIHPRGPKARTHRTPSYSRITPEFLGEGLHLRNGATKIKFVTIEELMSNLIAKLDPQNAGVLL
ncbi:hypothetical protein PHLCEN_2v10206 [Hermanssonia centrifuga]|uniref:DUF1771 domain-containing protein n=1 Tax=Hermanssonia centrifuga TaxID=98765 RepID=A0A2R6NNL9_9APHY|nr:hypothetical protein PHLCEN_2v10206 [Hermanssonia centrifuga]